MQRFSSVIRPIVSTSRSSLPPLPLPFPSSSSSITSLRASTRWFTTGEEVASLKRKLMYRSNHRGMRENDLILGSFAETYLASLNTKEMAKYEELLDELDPELFLWFTGKVDPPTEWAKDDIFLRVQKHALTFAQKNK